MKTLEQWLSAYGESHQNPLNKTIHWICVPVIYFTVLGLLYAVHSWVAYASTAMAMAFYFRLSPSLAAGMLLISAAMLALMSVTPYLILVCAALFVLAWVGQFYGHIVEGKKPSFFQDLQFLLIGPIWLLHFVYQRWQLKV